MSELSEQQRGLIKWLGAEEFSQYGECHGSALDGLIAMGLVQVHSGREGQSGFIAKGDTQMHQAVSLTEAGRQKLKDLTGS